MTKRGYPIIAAALALVLLVACVVVRKAPAHAPDPHPLKPLFWDATTFYPAVEQARENTVDNGTIRGAVVPHHLLASPLIADVFHRLERQRITRVVLIGPNHYERGNFAVLTTRHDWDTPIGIVETDTASVDTLMSAHSFVGTDDEAIELEHSLSGIMPFIKQYLPDAQVVPLAISMKLTPEEIGTLVDSLADVVDGETVVVASVDFSHYLSSEEALARNKDTLVFLRHFDLEPLLALSSQYMDSPRSIGILFMLMQRQKLDDFTLLANTTSAQFGINPNSETTSYLTLLFER